MGKTMLLVGAKHIHPRRLIFAQGNLERWERQRQQHRCGCSARKCRFEKSEVSATIRSISIWGWRFLAKEMV